MPTQRSAARGRGPSSSAAAELTTQLARAGTTAELYELVQQRQSELGPIPVAASIVQLAKLEAAWADNDPHSAKSRQQPGASSSSGRGQGGGGRAATRGSGSRVASSRGGSSAPEQPLPPLASPGKATTADAEQLMRLLADRFLAFSAARQYRGMRQYANVTWALAKLPFEAPAELVQEVAERAVDDDGARLLGAAPQEVGRPDRKARAADCASAYLTGGACIGYQGTGQGWPGCASAWTRT
jgi:hypothetical protein